MLILKQSKKKTYSDLIQSHLYQMRTSAAQRSLYEIGTPEVGLEGVK